MKECVILIHGLGRTKSSMNKLKKEFSKNDFDVVNWSYNSMTKNITSNAFILYSLFRSQQIFHDKVYFVTHSLGGLIVRCMMKTFNIYALDGLVMIAPPNNGSSYAKYLFKNNFIKNIIGPAGKELINIEHINKICAVPKSNLMVIAGIKSLSIVNPNSWISQFILNESNDGTVTFKETILPLMDKFITVNSTHTNIMKNPITIKEAVDFIKELDE